MFTILIAFITLILIISIFSKKKKIIFVVFSMISFILMIINIYFVKYSVDTRLLNFNYFNYSQKPYTIEILQIIRKLFNVINSLIADSLAILMSIIAICIILGKITPIYITSYLHFKLAKFIDNSKEFLVRNKAEQIPLFRKFLHINC